MSKFDSYFLMKDEDVIQYTKEVMNYFPADAKLHSKEIGDGNLNYIFRVWDDATGKSVIIKQAGHTARISDEFVLSTNRNKIEAEILQLEGKLAPGFTPEVYKYDDTMKCLAMEDLSDYTIMRTALMQHQTFPLFADHISTFMVNTLLLTTDVVMNHKEKKELVGRFINPDLCEITEDLVYTEPYNDYNKRNLVFPPNLEWVTKELYEDAELRLEAAKLKFQFMTDAEALLHGDLHTGSIFILPESTKVIDPEFAFYGPMGYDVGNVIANLIFAWLGGDATISDAAKRASYLGWLEQTIVDTINLFNAKFRKAWAEHATEILAKDDDFMEWYLSKVMRDTAAVAGLELNRRIVGIAQVKDITTIADEAKRVRAERIAITTAKHYIKNRTSYTTGEDFLATLKQSATSIK